MTGIQDASVLADYFIVANGSNPNQVQAMVDNVEEELDKAGYECRQIEGYGSIGWILMDYDDIITHMFPKGDRLFYDLERIRGDGKLAEEGELQDWNSACPDGSRIVGKLRFCDFEVVDRVYG